MKFTRAQEIKSLIGNTPLLEIRLIYKGEDRVIFAKAESLNMTGSIKDRMAFHILNHGYQKGVLRPGMQIYEATSGNTGISVAALGRAFGHQVNIFMPDWMSTERINLIKSLGAKITLVSKEQGGFLGSIEMAKQAAALTGGFVSSQFSNEDNSDAHYLTTGPEIWWQMKVNDMAPDAFVAGVGSGGTVMGVGKFLKEQDKRIKVYPLEPSNSPTISTGHKIGKHRIQGISDEFIPPIVHLNELDEVISVDDGDAIIMAQKLAAEIGLAVGISSGANLIGALIVQNRLGRDKMVATVFPDSNKKYLSTDLLKEEPVKDGFISTDVELVGFSAQKRVCKLCFSQEEAAVEYLKTV
jgi:cysteine synthase A